MSKGRNLRFSVAGGIMAGAVLLAGLLPSVASAQDMDARWLPWLGCWEAVEGGEDAPLLCVQPSSQAGAIEFLTLAEGEITATETILADAVPRNAEREECQGLEEARFSDDGHRVYLKSDYVCEGGVERAASGILAMINPMEWVDIKAVEGTPWVMRYRLARASKVVESGMENVVASRAGDVKSARIAASARLTEEDLMEAVGKVDGQAVEALIVERGDPFAVNADMLIRMDESGVPEGVIDLVVAVSFPDRFAVKAGPMPVEEYVDDSSYAPRRRLYMGTGLYDPYYGYGYSPFYYGGYGYGYRGYGYGGYGYGGYGGYGYYNPSPIVVVPRTSGGQMIKGQGYTRGGSSGGGSARSRGGYSAGGTRSSGSAGVRSGGSSSSGRVAKPRRSGGSSGVSSGGTSSKTRTAKPRRSGGGGLI